MSHVAVILAAGGSTRLGRPKQLLTIDGETLVHRAVRLALDTGPARTMVVVGADAHAVSAAVTDLKCEIVVNLDWMRGLASSLACAGACLPEDTTFCLVLGCDQPRVSWEHLRSLVGARGQRRRSSAIPGFVPREPLVCAASSYEGVIGIPACVPAQWLRDVDVSAGDRGLGPRLRSVPDAQRAVVVDNALANDLDTPADVAAAVAAGVIDPA